MARGTYFSTSGTHAGILYSEFNFAFFGIILIICIILLSVFSVVWGLTTLIGIIFLMMAMIILILNRGEGISPWMFLTCIIIGVFFLIIGYAGVELITVDLRVIPGIERLHNFVNL